MNNLDNPEKYDVQRYKGLGEMDPEQLWETTMDPERRTLRQVEISDMTEVDRVVNELMGNDVECRRTFITEHAADIDERFLDCLLYTSRCVYETDPLFIYGNSGLGKTHLLVAIANYAMQNFPRMATRYVSANKFLNDYVEATQRNQWGTFNSKYHQVDILLVDDVQYLEGKDETINQLFNIFNEMTNRNKQIVLSADRAPKDIDMDDRMRSRFISGLLADIKPPDYETRLAILKDVYKRQRLYSIKRVASSANQNGQVTTYDSENNLLIIAFVFVDFSAFCIEVGEDRS